MPRAFTHALGARPRAGEQTARADFSAAPRAIAVLFGVTGCTLYARVQVPQRIGAVQDYVLVVDDDESVREVIAAVLQDEGFPVATATNGREALDRIAERRPAVVLLDLQMPIMSGWEVLSELRAAECPVPIVFMSAGYRVKTEAERHHADAYIAKPFDLNELLRIVGRFTSASPA